MHTIASLTLAAFALGAAAQPIKYPETPRKQVTDTYHGTPVAEDYRWLEDGKDPAVRQWSLKQLDVTRAYPTGGGSIAWDAKSTGFYYTRYPQGNERAKEDANFYQQVWFHKLGTPASADSYVIGKEFPRIAETQLSTTRDGRYLLASVAN